MLKTAPLADFMHKYLGLGNVGENPINRGQCVGLIEVWLTSQGKPHIDGNAVGLMANALRTVYKVTNNAPDNYPQPGDIVCWDKTWGGGFGHTAVVVAANSMFLAVFEQNDPEGYVCTVATHGYSGVAGWISW
jgi:hypothetical protein